MKAIPAGEGLRHLSAHGRTRSGDPDGGGHGPADRHQSGPPRLLESGGPWGRRNPQPAPPHRGRPLHPVGPGKIPTGEVAPVAGTAFDFRTIRPIGAHIDDISQVPEAGYDHNFCLNGERGVLRRAARAIDPHSGRGLEIWTDQPGVQFYTANHFGTLPAMGKGAFLTVSMPVSRSRHRPTRIHRTSRISPRLCSGRARLIAMSCVFRSSLFDPASWIVS